MRSHDPLPRAGLRSGSRRAAHRYELGFGQNFSFLGYLPAEPTARKTKLKLLEQTILKQGTTQIFIEAPFRNQHLFDALLSNLNSEIRLCVGINLMTNEQQIISHAIHEWKRKPLKLDKQEVIFLIGS